MRSVPALISYLISQDYDSDPKGKGRRTQLFNLGLLLSTLFSVLRVPKMTVIALSDLI